VSRNERNIIRYTSPAIFLIFFLFFSSFFCRYNVFNTLNQEPVSKEARDPLATARLYELSADLLEEVTGRPLPHRQPPKERLPNA
jgi:hypothetical protein